MHRLIAKGADFIRASRKILVFSGSGLSMESGVPDFSSPIGFWGQYSPSEFYFDRIITDEAFRSKYWRRNSQAYQIMKSAIPNAGHRAVTILEEKGSLIGVVTQNVDTLHQRAGIPSGKILELHGNAFTVQCLNCERRYDRDEIEERIGKGIEVPCCDDCAGILKPDTLSFGQPIPEDKMAQAVTYARACDLCVVLGSSLLAYPATFIPEHAFESGAKLIIINRDQTHLDYMADVVLHESISNVLEKMVRS